MTKRRAVGKNVLRKEGHEKVTGRARYIDDIPFDNVLYVRTIRSTVPAGAITDIRYAFDRDGFTVVDHRDVPGRNIVALIDEDQPSLAASEVRHVAEPILLLAHADRNAARRRRSCDQLQRDRRQLRRGALIAVLQDDRHRQGDPREGSG